jgi:dihydrofolate reductase/thymidylate synthase
MLRYDVVVAADEKGGIGKEGKLPWKLPGDTKFFKELTSGTEDGAKRNAVIMGRKTWDTIPPRFRPLDRRLNVVVTRNAALELPDGVLRASSIENAVELIDAEGDAVERVFLIGGGQLYAIGMDLPNCRMIYLTRVLGHFECDAFIPEPGDDYDLRFASDRQEENGLGYIFEVYERIGERTVEQKKV